MIHAVWAVYDSPTFDPKTRVYKDEPLYYECHACPFVGTLEQSVEHVVSNQFNVIETVELGV